MIHPALDVVHRRLYGSENRIAWQPAQIAAILSKFGATGIDLRDHGAGGYRPAAAMPAIGKAAAATDDGKSRTFTATISDGSIDRMFDQIPVTAWRFDNYIRTNPVVLHQHDANLVPIGRASRIWIDGGQRLKAAFHLAPADVNPVAQQVLKAIDGGFLNAVSVGFMPLKISFANDPARPYGINFEVVELLEFSVVGIPALRSALIDAPSPSGKAMDQRERDRRRRERDLDVVRLRAGR